MAEVVPTSDAGKPAPGHILVDEDYIDAVMDTVKSKDFEDEFGALPGVGHDDADKAGLVALHWHDEARDPGDVTNQIRQIAPELTYMVAPDHALGIVVREDPHTGTSVDMGGPAAIPPKPTNRRFEPRSEGDLHGKGVTVGVIDSGWRDHEHLAGAFLASPGNKDPLDEDRDRALDKMAGHGTFVTGLVLREAPAATVRIVRAFNTEGRVPIRRAANAMLELDELGVDIINLSFGGHSRGNRKPLPYRKALSKLRDTTVVVAAAGNHDPSSPAAVADKARNFWPAAMPNVLAVAALDQVQNGNVRLANFSNYGSWVDLATIGADVISTYVNVFDFDGWAEWSGTSFAAPTVAGRIAANMTDQFGRRVCNAQEAKQRVLDEGRERGRQGGTVGPFILPSNGNGAVGA